MRTAFVATPARARDYAPAREQVIDLQAPSIDPTAVLMAGLVGALAAIGYNVGVAAAGGQAITASMVWGDISTGAVGGMATAVLVSFGLNAIVAGFIGALVGGWFYQLLFPPAPPVP